MSDVRATLDPASARRRLKRSLAVGAVAAALGLGAFVAISAGPDADGLPAALRGGHLLNERLWSSLRSNARFSVARPAPAAGKNPRENGTLGLENAVVDADHYSVQVESGDRKVRVPLAELRALPKAGYSTDFRCIEGWSEVMQYAGTRFSEFMDAYKVGRKPDGTLYRYVGLETPDGEYYVSIDMDSMLHPQTLLAYEMNERPLRPIHGAPLRLVIPIKYGIKSLKRVGRIFFSDERPPDYWAEQGYDWFSAM